MPEPADEYNPLGDSEPPVEATRATADYADIPRDPLRRQRRLAAVRDCIAAATFD